MSRYTLTSKFYDFRIQVDWMELHQLSLVCGWAPDPNIIVNCQLWSPCQTFALDGKQTRFLLPIPCTWFWDVLARNISQAKTGPRVNTFLQDKLHGAGLNLGVIILQHMERLPPKFNENSNSLCRRNLIFGQQYVVLWTEFLCSCGLSPRSIFARSWWAKPGFLFRPWMPLDLFDFRPWHSLIPPLSLLQWSASHWSSVQSVPGCVWGRNFETR